MVSLEGRARKRIKTGWVRQVNGRAYAHTGDSGLIFNTIYLSEHTGVQLLNTELRVAS